MQFISVLSLHRQNKYKIDRDSHTRLSRTLATLARHSPSLAPIAHRPASCLGVIFATHGRRVASPGQCLSVPSPSSSRRASMVGHAENAHDVRHLDHLSCRRFSLEVAQPVDHVDVVDETCAGHAMIGPTPQARHACSASRCEGVEQCSVRIRKTTQACWQPGLIG